MKTEDEIRAEIKRCKDALGGLSDDKGNVEIAVLYAGKVTALEWVLAE